MTDMVGHPNQALGDILRKWPTTMAIIVLDELYLYYQLDAQSIIDLWQYIGKEEDYIDFDMGDEDEVDEYWELYVE